MTESRIQPKRGESTILGTSMIWVSLLIFAASNSVVLLLNQLGAMQLIDGRNAISFCNLLFVGNLCAFVVLSAIFWKSRTRKNLSALGALDWFNLVIVAALSGALAPTLIFFALQQTTVTNVLLMGRIEPPLMLLCSALFFKEKMDRWAVIGTIVAIIGGLVVFGLQYKNDPMAFGFGEIYAGLAAIIWVVVTLISVQYLHSVPLGIFSIMRTAIGTLVFAAIVVSLFGTVHFQDAFSPFVWKWMLVYGGIIIVVGQLCWYKGIAMTSTAQVSLANSFTPAAGVIIAVIFLGETPNEAILIGGAIIIIGIAIAQMGAIFERRAKPCRTTDEAVKLEGSLNFKGV